MTSLFNRGFLLVGIATLLLLGVVVLSRVPENAAAQASSSDRTLTVTGHGQVTGKPDLATVRLGVETTASTAAQAMAVTGQKLNAVLAAIKALGIEDKDIQTTALNLFPIRRPFPIIQQEGEQTPTAPAIEEPTPTATPTPAPFRPVPAPSQIWGYRAVSQVRVTVRDLDKAVWVIDGAVGQGANLVSGVSFGISDPTAKQNQALQKAVQAAQAKADVLAQAAGVSVTGVQSLAKGGFAGPFPISAPAFEGRGIAVPIEPGQLTLSASVTIVFTIG